MMLPATGEGLPIQRFVMRQEGVMIRLTNLFAGGGGTSLLKHIYVAGKQKEIIVQVRFGLEPMVIRDRKLLGEELQKAVEALFVPVAKEIPEVFTPLRI